MFRTSTVQQFGLNMWSLHGFSEESYLSAFPVSMSKFSVRPWRSRGSSWRHVWIVVWLIKPVGGKWRWIMSEVESSDALVGKTGSHARRWMRNQRRTEELVLRWPKPSHVVLLVKRSEEKLWDWVKKQLSSSKKKIVLISCWLMIWWFKRTKTDSGLPCAIGEVLVH